MKTTPTLVDYIPIVGDGVVSELRLLGELLIGKRVININSTRVGGGVAEILGRLVPLMTEIGLDARWEIVHGTEEFFGLTKRLHNSLHGMHDSFGPHDREVYDEVTRENLKSIDLNANVVFIHDPQPAGLVRERYHRDGKWIWRCHIDLSAPAPGAWEFIEGLVVATI